MYNDEQFADALEQVIDRGAFPFGRLPREDDPSAMVDIGGKMVNIATELYELVANGRSEQFSEPLLTLFEVRRCPAEKVGDKWRIAPDGADDIRHAYHCASEAFEYYQRNPGKSGNLPSKEENEFLAVAISDAMAQGMPLDRTPQRWERAMQVAGFELTRVNGRVFPETAPGPPSIASAAYSRAPGHTPAPGDVPRSRRRPRQIPPHARPHGPGPGPSRG